MNSDFHQNVIVRRKIILFLLRFSMLNMLSCAEQYKCKKKKKKKEKREREREKKKMCLKKALKAMEIIHLKHTWLVWYGAV